MVIDKTWGILLGRPGDPTRPAAGRLIPLLILLLAGAVSSQSSAQIDVNVEVLLGRQSPVSKVTGEMSNSDRASPAPVVSGIMLDTPSRTSSPSSLQPNKGDVDGRQAPPLEAVGERGDGGSPSTSSSSTLAFSAIALDTLSPLLLPPSPSPMEGPSGGLTGGPVGGPTNDPTGGLTTSPTTSPATSAKTSPTTSPMTFSLRPAAPPTLSAAPTSSDLRARPSLRRSATKLLSSAPSSSLRPSNPPSNPMTFNPINAPSQMPSLTDKVVYQRNYQQNLLVSAPMSFDEEQMGFFCFTYQQYTKSIGYMSSEGITSKCTVTSQMIGINPRASRRADRMFHRERQIRKSLMEHLGNERKVQETPPEYPLTMRFTMRYSTRVGTYDISNYNELFRDYINGNLDIVVENLANLNLPVVNATDALMLKPPDITQNPSSAPSFTPTLVPSSSSPTLEPSARPITNRPTTEINTWMTVPSGSPNAAPPGWVDVTDSNFIFGMTFGLIGALAIMTAFVMYHRCNKEKRKEEAGSGTVRGDCHFK